jgi:hypothetical protein
MLGMKNQVFQIESKIYGIVVQFLIINSQIQMLVIQMFMSEIHTFVS